jgi:hypothetical protein
MKIATGNALAMTGFVTIAASAWLAMTLFGLQHVAV